MNNNNLADRDYLTKPDNEFHCLNKTVVLLPGSFKPPHKGHLEMVMSTIDFADEIHIFISNTSEKYILGRTLAKTRFSKFLSLFKKFKYDNQQVLYLIEDIKNTALIIPYNELKLKIEQLINLTKFEYPDFSNNLQLLYNNLNTDLFKSIRYTSEGKCIEPEIAEEIFQLYIKDYHVGNKVFTHICENPMPLMAAAGYANYQCKNCKIYIGSTTEDELAERDSGWNIIMKACAHNTTNEIIRLPVATKVQAARDIRKNINNLTKDMFPPLITNETFQCIKFLLTGEQEMPILENKKFVSKFNLLYESIMKSLVTESGIAIHDIEPVKLENIGPTVQKLYNEILAPLGIKFDALTYLGSTGKKQVSGDLDLGLDLQTALVDTNSENKEELAEKIGLKCEEYGYQFANALTSQFKTIHIGIPIVHQEGVAQVDIMMTQNLDYAKFRFHSPTPEESKYKGAARSTLLKAIFYVCSKQADINAAPEDQQEFIDKNGHKHYIQSSTLSLDMDGILKTVHTYRGKRGNIKSTKEILSKEILDVRDVQEMLDLLFHGLYTVSDFNSFESIWNNVIFNESFPYKDKIEGIIKTFIGIWKRDNSWQLEQNKLPFPDEIIQYATEHNIEL